MGGGGGGGFLANTSFYKTNYLGVRVGQRRTVTMMSTQSVQ
jgi:hypothetical protein